MRTSVRYRERKLAETALAAGAAFGCGAFESDQADGRRRSTRTGWFLVALGLLAVGIVYFLLR